MAVSLDLPKTQRAIVVSDNLDYCIRDDVSLPPLQDDCIIIKTEAVGLNPVDTKMVGPFVAPGAVYGIDSAGILVAIGKDVAATNRWKIGDRVCGAADGMEALRPYSGCFAEYASLDGGMAMKMPDDMTFATGAGMGLRIATSAMALFHSLGLPLELLKTPAEKPFDVLVYGGSTSTGTLAIQLVKLCGLRAITTCSPYNFDLVKSYGADVCFDYKSPTCGQDIRSFTENELEYAVDCITEEKSMEICYQALGRCGGKYVGLEPYPEQAATRRTVTPDWILATWMRGLRISWPEPFGTQGDLEAKKFADAAFPYVHPLFASGKLRPHPTEVQPDGFEGLLHGVSLVRQGKISGKKMVYRTGDRRAVTTAA